MFEHFFDLVGHYLLIIGFCLILSFSLIFFFFKNSNIIPKKFLVSRLGFHFFDTSKLANEFHAGMKIAGDIYLKNLVLLTGTEDLKTENLKPIEMTENDLSWQVFPESIIIKADNNLFLDSDFLNLTGLLGCYRTSKPLNSFVLSISIDDLLNNEKINLVSNQLLKFKNFVYPIYLIIQDTTSTYSLNKLYSIMSKEELTKTIGWSDDPSNNFSNSKYLLPNIDKTIDIILKDIIKGLKEIIYSKLSTFEYKNAQEIILMLNQLPESLSIGLKKIILKIFSSNEHYFLRGIYLSDGKNFISNLFFKSIFIEDLSNHIYQSKYSIYSLMALRASIFFSIVGILYLPFLQYNLMIKSEKAEFSIDKINYLLKRSKNCSDESFKKFNLESEKVVKNLPLFFPWSTFSRLKIKVYKLLALAYNRIILNNVFSLFNNLVTDLSKGKMKHVLVKIENPLFKNEEFIDLVRYLSEIIRLEDVEEDLVEISRNSGLLQLASAVKKLFNVDLPSRLSKTRKMYRAAFNYRLPNINKLANFEQSLQSNLEKKFSLVCNLILNPDGIFDQIATLSKNLVIIASPPSSYSLSDLNQLKNAMEAIINAFKAFEFLLSDETPKDLQNLLTSISKSITLNKNLSTEINSKYLQIVQDLKSKLLSVNLPVFGRIFTKKEKIILDSSFEISLQIIKSYFEKNFDILSTIKSEQQFLNPFEKSYLRNVEQNNNYGSTEWNLQELRFLFAKITDFESFLCTSLEKIEGTNRVYISIILKQVFIKSLESSISKCLSPMNPINENDYDSIEKLTQAIQLILQIIRFLEKESHFDSIEKLAKIIAIQIDLILQKEYLKAKEIYNINSEQIKQKQLNTKQINEYLSSNRRKLKNAYEKVKMLIDYGSTFENLGKIEINSLKDWKSIQEMLDESSGIIENLEESIRKMFEGEQVDNQISKNEFVSSQIEQNTKTLNIKLKQISQEELKLIYPKIQAKFYENLAGFFPFAPLNQPDLPLDKMNDFIQFWTENESSINNIIASMKLSDESIGPEKRQWYIFLCNIALAVKWMKHLLNPEKYPASLEIIPRPDRSKEKNSPDLIALRILLSDGSRFVAKSFPDARMEIGSILKTQYLGYSRLDFSMQFASESKFSFQKTSGYPKFTGASYKGPFCLLRFIKNNRSYVDENGNLYLLLQKAIFNKNQNSEIIVSLQIKLFGIEYPTFPRSCPDLIQ